MSETTDRRWSEAAQRAVATAVADWIARLNTPTDDLMPLSAAVLDALADARLLADPQELERRVADAQTTCADDDELTRLRQEANAHEGELGDMRAQLSAAEAERDAARDEIQHAQDQTALAVSAQRETERALDAARAEAERLRAELAELHAQRITSVVFAHHRGAPRPFGLYRRTDVTGVSGTGLVAEGAAFSDGSAVLRWLSDWPTSVVFHDRGIEAIEKIHGHGGATELVWLSDELEPLAAMEQERDELRARVAELERPGRWELPPEPGPEVVEVWDRDGKPHQRHPDFPDTWVSDFGWLRGWSTLVAERGPLSAAPPEPAGGGQA